MKEPVTVKQPQVMTEFEFSRIYAQGWNAARGGSSKPAVRNPYPADPERERWRQGFMAGSA